MDLSQALRDLHAAARAATRIAEETGGIDHPMLDRRGLRDIARATGRLAGADHSATGEHVPAFEDA